MMAPMSGMKGNRAVAIKGDFLGLVFKSDEGLGS